MHNRDRAFYQYALLNLALLHADFECYTEALSAIEETIAVARENNDLSCLNYSLSWLYHFGKAHPSIARRIQDRGLLGPDRETLAFLKAKARDTQMWSLLSTALLSEAKMILIQGGSAAQAFENCLKASHINMTKDVPSGIGAEKMMTMALFNRLGVTYQAAVTRDIFQHCYSQSAPLDDSTVSACAGADLLAQKGRLQDAIIQLEALADTGPTRPSASPVWIIQLGLLKLRRCLLQ